MNIDNALGIMLLLGILMVTAMAFYFEGPARMFHTMLCWSLWTGWMLAILLSYYLITLKPKPKKEEDIKK